MDRLASCYFCGVAVDAPLEEYPVVPRDLRPSVENQQTVVLCPQCRRKLSTIVDSVVAATADPDQTTLPGNESDTGTADSDDADETVEGTADGTESSEGRPADESLIEGFGHDEPSLIEVEGTPKADEPTAGDGVSPESREESPPADVDDSEKADATTDTGRADTEGGDETDSENADGGARDATAGTSERDFSKTAHNRVVRLLQNRAFPLEVEEITTIAASAYEIERRETEAIIEALVERGVIEREGDQLFRPDSGGD